MAIRDFRTSNSTDKKGNTFWDQTAQATGKAVGGTVFKDSTHYYHLFTVVASGSMPLTYQWKKNGVSISGATSSTYNIPSITGGDAASYTCVVTDVNGASVTSNAAVLTVNTVITINYGWFASNPLADVEAGNPITYNVT